MEEEEEEEEGPEGSRQELDALQRGEEVEEGDISIKEEVFEGEEEVLAANPVGSMLTEGQAAAIPTDWLQELEVKEEEQYEGIERGHLATSGGEGEGTEQKPILLEDEEGEAVEDEENETVAGNEVACKGERHQVIKGKEKAP